MSATAWELLVAAAALRGLEVLGPADGLPSGPHFLLLHGERVASGDRDEIAAELSRRGVAPLHVDAGGQLGQLLGEFRACLSDAVAPDHDH